MQVKMLIQCLGCLILMKITNYLLLPIIVQMSRKLIVIIIQIEISHGDLKRSSNVPVRYYDEFCI